MDFRTEDKLPCSASVAIVSGRAMMLEMLSETFETMGVNVLDAVHSAAELTNYDEDCVYVVQVPSARDAALEGLQAISENYPDCKILVLCDVGETEGLRNKIPSQVHAIITDEFSTEILVSATRLVNAGLVVSPSTVETQSRSVHGQSNGQELTPYGDDALLSLTKREVAVLARLKDGLENKVIANELGVSEATVKVHLRGLYRKTGAKNRTQAALWATRHL